MDKSVRDQRNDLTIACVIGDLARQIATGACFVELLPSVQDGLMRHRMIQMHYLPDSVIMIAPDIANLFAICQTKSGPNRNQRVYQALSRHCFLEYRETRRQDGDYFKKTGTHRCASDSGLEIKLLFARQRLDNHPG